MQGQLRQPSSFGAWERLRLLPDPQPLADLFHEGSHRASLRRFDSRWPAPPGTSAGAHDPAMSVSRHVRAIGLLPGMVTLAVPAIIVWRTDAVSVGWGLPR